MKPDDMDAQTWLKNHVCVTVADFYRIVERGYGQHCKPHEEAISERKNQS